MARHLDTRSGAGNWLIHCRNFLSAVAAAIEMSGRSVLFQQQSAPGTHQRISLTGRKTLPYPA
jgi:hypothetical protein